MEVIREVAMLERKVLDCKRNLSGPFPLALLRRREIQILQRLKQDLVIKRAMIPPSIATWMELSGEIEDLERQACASRAKIARVGTERSQRCEEVTLIIIEEELQAKRSMLGLDEVA